MADVTVSDTIREMRDAIVRIAAKHGATQVRLIGSVARGEARPDSDVDLLVTWTKRRSCWSWRNSWAGRSTSPVMDG